MIPEILQSSLLWLPTESHRVVRCTWVLKTARLYGCCNRFSGDQNTVGAGSLLISQSCSNHLFILLCNRNAVQEKERERDRERQKERGREKEGQKDRRDRVRKEEMET